MLMSKQHENFEKNITEKTLILDQHYCEKIIFKNKYKNGENVQSFC
jgi:hypothetical protein